MSSQQPSEDHTKLIGLIIILISVCCCVTGLTTGLSYLYFKPQSPLAATQTEIIKYSTLTPQIIVSPIDKTRVISTLAEGEKEETPENSGVLEAPPTQTPFPTLPADETASEDAYETLLTLDNTIIPINNPISLAERLGGKPDVPKTFPDLDVPYEIGAMKSFWVSNVDTNQHFQVNATLQYRGENVYIWIENGISYSGQDLKKLGDTFDQEIYPTNQAFFGSEWSPGIDGDPRIYILYAGGLGSSLAGYFSSADEIHPDAHEYSNAHEMFLINSDTVYLWEDYIYGTLAHEFQHMIHWYTDKNEETWLNEGFSMLAELLNGYDTGGFDFIYINNPDVQLTDWGTEVGSNGPYYGAAFLFTTYFLDRFGDEATQAVVAHDENGMISLDLVLEELGIRDPLTDKQILSEDVFGDWAVANLLGDPNAADGRYHYNIYPEAPQAKITETITKCPSVPKNYDVHQFGVDYIEIDCSGVHELEFTGSTETTILPTTAFSGDYFFWSNMGDESNMMLQQTFDLREITEPVEMTYQTWYDLEEDYDYIFIVASADGENWQILDSTSCTTEDPSGNSYGCGLNGQSNGWQEESVDLSQFAGEEVTLRFEYITDAAVNGVGMIIDNIAIDALDYFTDFEEDQGGWEASGFVRIQNLLPQTYRMSLITMGNQMTVTTIELDESNKVSVDLDLSGDVERAVLVVSGTTPYTRQKTLYQLEVK